MASGTINGTTNNEFIICKIEWSSVADVASNKSTITAALYYKRTNTGYTTYGNGRFTISINRIEVYGAYKDVTITENSWVKVAEVSQTISHKDDGTLPLIIGGSGFLTGTTLSATYCESGVTLDTIPRATTLDLFVASQWYFPGPVTIKFTPKSASFYNRCKFSIDGTELGWHNLGQHSASQRTITYTIPEQWLPTIYTTLSSDARGGYLRIDLFTYSDSGYRNQVGDSYAKTAYLYIPNDSTTQPTVSMSLSPSNNLSSPYNSLYIQGISKVKASLGFEAKYGATVVESSIAIYKFGDTANSGKTYNSPYETDILTQSGAVTVKATVKDSRGHYGTNYKDIEVIPYSKPYVSAYSGESSIIAARCDASANINDSGTYLKIKAKVVYSKVISGGVQNNYGKIKFRYRNEGGSYSAWQTIHDSETDSNHSDEVITDKLLNGDLNVATNYQVQIVAFDDLYESDPITIAVPSVKAYMHRPAGGKSMGLGGYSSGDGNLDVYWKIKARDGMSLIDTAGNETPVLASAQLNPHDQLAAGWNPDNLANGVYAVSGSKPLQVGESVIMRNGVLIQMSAYDNGSVKIQLALTSDEDRNPYYRVHWYGSWGNWRSFKL